MGKKDQKRASGTSFSDMFQSMDIKVSKDVGGSKPVNSGNNKINVNNNINNNKEKRITEKKDSEKKFINPYTFVPISKKEPERIKFEELYKDSNGKIDGCIECSLETKSSVFVPNTSRTFECGFNDFFSYEDLSKKSERAIPKEAPKYPRIPGSEIRGMVRSIYEQLTDSCLSVIDNENLAVKRSPKPKAAGVWDRSKDVLYEAGRRAIKEKEVDVLKEKSGEEFITGKEVFVHCNQKGYVQNISFDNNKNAESGFIIKGEKFQNKKSDSVIVPKFNKVVKNQLTQLDKDRFKAVLDRYAGYEDYKKAYNSDIRFLPIFYEKVESNLGDKLYMSPAMITKEVFENTISEILEQNHFKHQPCNAETGFCPACRLFGTIANEKSIASRLRFTDTEVFENAVFDEPRFIPVLGMPRYSSTEFYLQKPKDSKVAMWNYDYYTINGRNKIEKQITYKPHLKGRKVYWQGADKLSAEKKLDRKDEIKNLNIRSACRALKQGSKTKFKVYFEDISKTELGALLYSLTLGKECNHRIGRGKPYGMGAIKVNIEKLTIRKFVFEEGKICIKEDCEDPKDYKLSTLEEENKKYIEIYSTPLSNSEACIVGYPKPLTQDEIFKWFAKNRGRTIQAPQIDQVLPDITDKVKSLNQN